MRAKSWKSLEAQPHAQRDEVVRLVGAQLQLVAAIKLYPVGDRTGEAHAQHRRVAADLAAVDAEGGPHEPGVDAAAAVEEIMVPAGAELGQHRMRRVELEAPRDPAAERRAQHVLVLLVD